MHEIASAMHGFYVFVKFCLVLICILKLYFKVSSSILFRKKKNSIHYLHFSFEKHVLSQFLKDVSVANLETTPSKIFCEIYLSRIIHNWGIIFTSYRTWGTFSLVCVLSVFFFFSFFLLLFFFYWYFPWQTLAIHRIAVKGDGITR